MQVEKLYLAVYRVLQAVSIPFVPLLGLYCVTRAKYRNQFLMRLGVGLAKPAGKGPLIWIHAMSLGEYHAARPLIRHVSSGLKGARILVSATTASGLNAIKRDKFRQDKYTTTVLPFDLSFVTKRFISKIKPDCFVLVETDIWPGLLHQLRQRGCSIILANGSISSKSAKRLSRLPGAAEFLYGPFSCLGMQSKDDARRLLDLGLDAEKIVTLGNLKFDIRPPQISDTERARLLKATGFDQKDTIICCGSTHEPEERLLLDTFLKVRKQASYIKIIVAPRDVRRAEKICTLCERLSLKWRRRSADSGERTPDVFIIDTLGELLSFYALSTVSFVGGSLARIGGHNLLEPVYFKKPVIFGPHIESCREMAQALIRAGAGFCVSDKTELEKTMKELLYNENRRRRAKESAACFMKSHQGVAKRYVDIIKAKLNYGL